MICFIFLINVWKKLWFSKTVNGTYENYDQKLDCQAISEEILGINF